MAVITVISTNEAGLAFDAMMHGIESDYRGRGLFELSGNRTKIERIAAKNGAKIVSDYDITDISS